MIQELKQLELSSKDFDMLIEGLEALPEKGAVGDLMGDLLIGVLSKNEEEKKELQSKAELRNAEKKREKELKKEDIRILQGKLYLLKRHMTENNLLKQANDALNS